MAGLELLPISATLEQALYLPKIPNSQLDHTMAGIFPYSNNPTSQLPVPFFSLKLPKV